MTDRVALQPDRSRYVLLREEGGASRELGEATFRLEGDTIVFDHTEVDPEIGERGLGSTLVRGALEHVRAERSERVVAECSFVRAYLEKHPEFEDLTTR
ncbi:MAG: N-acetyltransferase [Actinomycetales bacterium]|nr:N-acetyltransferase [Actinomycetales bacterium]